MSLIHKAGNHVVQDKYRWKKLWRRVHGTGPQLLAVPGIDFEKHTVVAACMGTVPTSGYQIRVMRAVDRGDYVEVIVQKSSPKAHPIVLPVTMRPVHIVVLPKINKPIRFVTVKMKG